MLQGKLGQVLVVKPDITLQRLRQTLTRFETVRGQHIADPAVEAFNHPIFLRAARLGQAVLNALLREQAVKLMLALAYFCLLNNRSVN